MSPMRAAILLAALASVAPALAQSPQRPGAPVPVITLETLTRQGFEIKAMTRSSDRQAHFVVILQRAGDARTCLLRIQRDARGHPQRQSLCF